MALPVNQPRSIWLGKSIPLFTFSSQGNCGLHPFAYYREETVVKSGLKSFTLVVLSPQGSLDSQIKQ